MADTLRFLVDGLGKRGPCDGGIFDCVTGGDFGVSIFFDCVTGEACGASSIFDCVTGEVACRIFDCVTRGGGLPEFDCSRSSDWSV